MTVLVTGGGGFLGGAIVRRLVADGVAVRSFSRGRYAELEALGVASFQGDLGDADAVMRAVDGCDAVFHVAAKAGVWGDARDYERINVTGTEHVLAACRRAGVPRLVHTSSPSVVFDGRDEEGADGSLPYPSRFLCDYPRTKALAERAVLDANDATLSTVALRPHLIWGPGDPHLVPRIIERARAGRLRLVGDGSNLVDSVYVDNAADAHLAALARLSPDAACAGRAYFITNAEPVPMAELINGILGAAGLPPVTKRISPRVAYGVGATLEAAYRLLGRRDEPLMTRFVARQLATAHWFDPEPARRDLGYEPRVSIAEGLERLAQSFP